MSSIKPLLTVHELVLDSDSVNSMLKYLDKLFFQDNLLVMMVFYFTFSSAANLNISFPLLKCAICLLPSTL